MNGPAHYLEAERLLTDVLPSTELPDEIVKRAQVHATLALAAATAQRAQPDGVWTDWLDVAS